jgi:WD40 repeat protein
MAVEVLQIVDTYTIDTRNVLALAYCKELNAIAAAGSGAFIKIVPLDRAQRMSGDVPLADTLHGHTQPITALAVLKDYVLVSAGHDRDIRFWDLHTMKVGPTRLQHFRRFFLGWIASSSLQSLARTGALEDMQTATRKAKPL